MTLLPRLPKPGRCWVVSEMKRLVGLTHIRVALLSTIAIFLAAATPSENRPFRLGMLKLLPEVDEMKPIGRENRVGILNHGDAIVGDFGNGWVGSRVFRGDRFNWWFDAGSELTSPLVNPGGFVVFGTRTGKLFKLDISSGKRSWEVALDSFVERKPLLAGSVLLVQTTAQVLYAIDYQTGKSLWVFDAGFPDGLAISAGAAPVVFGDTAIIGLPSGEVVGVNLADGKQVWRVNPVVTDARFRDVVGDMFVRDAVLHLTRYDGVVAAIDLKSSDIRTIWQERYPSIATSTFRAGRIYIGCINGDVVALDAGNQGRQLWRTITASPLNTITAAETKVVIAGANGHVSALDIQNGEVSWHDNVGYSVSSAPVFMPDGVYFVTGLGNAYGFHL